LKNILVNFGLKLNLVNKLNFKSFFFNFNIDERLQLTVIRDLRPTEQINKIGNKYGNIPLLIFKNTPSVAMSSRKVQFSRGRHYSSLIRNI